MGSDERFEVYKGDDGWRWRFQAANNEVQGSGEAYGYASEAEDGVRSFVRNIATSAGLPDWVGEALAANVTIIRVDA